jgi:hypothetical protein
MKRLLLLLLSIITYCTAFSQNVGIGTTSPHASAALDLNSTSKGILIPRMTTAQRTAIISPAAGLMVYDITSNSFWFYNGTTWSGVSGSGSLSLPFDAAVNISGNAFRIANTSATGVAITGETDSNIGILAKSNGAGTALTAMSNSGIAINAISTTEHAITASNNSGEATILSTNNNFGGVAIEAQAPNSTAILGISGGTSKAALRGEATGTSGIGVFGTTTSTTGYGMFATTGPGTAIYGTSTSGTGVRANSSTGLALDVTGRVKIAGGNTNQSDGAVLTSDANGNAVWKNNRVAFYVDRVNDNYRSASSGVSAKVHWKTELYDYGNDYLLLTGTNPGSATSTFTVPVSGLYHFDLKLYIYDDDAELSAVITRIFVKRGSTTLEAGYDDTIPFDYEYAFSRISNDFRLQAGDIVWVEVYPWTDDGSPVEIGTYSSYFNCHLIFQE